MPRDLSWQGLEPYGVPGMEPGSAGLVEGKLLHCALWPLASFLPVRLLLTSALCGHQSSPAISSVNMEGPEAGAFEPELHCLWR